MKSDLTVNEFIEQQRLCEIYCDMIGSDMIDCDLIVNEFIE